MFSAIRLIECMCSPFISSIASIFRIFLCIHVLFANFSAPINLREKIKINPSICYIGKRMVNDENISQLPSYFNVNLYFYYFYSKQLSAYLELNNLTNSKHDIWLGYRDIGLNGVFGLNFAF